MTFRSEFFFFSVAFLALSSPVSCRHSVDTLKVVVSRRRKVVLVVCLESPFHCPLAAYTKHKLIFFIISQPFEHFSPICPKVRWKDNYFGKRDVFRLFLKIATELDIRILIGKEFQRLGAADANLCRHDVS